MKLSEIEYKFIIELTKFFVGKYNDREIDKLDLIVRNVKLLSNFIKDMSFVYDETIWFYDKPETIRNLIEFRVQLRGRCGHLTFRLFLNKGVNQEVIMLDDSMVWQW